MPASREENGFDVHAVGIVHSPYREKFAVPRQPGLVPVAEAELHLLGDCNRQEVLRGLESFSHLWLVFVFHQSSGRGWNPTVRPPRLGGNRRLGVFATRSPFRPNPIGLSAVALKGIENRDGQWLLKLGGIDLVDGTPVLDIKPYVPYADALPDARGGFTHNRAPATLAVTFSLRARRQLASYCPLYPNLEQLIQQLIAQQPQPAYHRQDGDRHYGMALYDLNIRWQLAPEGAVVEEITRISGEES